MNPAANAAPRSRLFGRAEVVARALAARRGRRERPDAPSRILIAHHLLLGDTLMLTPLVAKLRARYPLADIAMTVPQAIAPLYETKPYQLRALAWSPRASPDALFTEGPFDVALVPGDNRYAWLAGAMRARWIVAHAGGAPAHKSWPVDELVPFPSNAGAWGDLVAQLVEGPAPAPFRPAAWPAPPASPFVQPSGRYAVLHVGASSPLKRWAPDRWQALAGCLAQRGLAPVWSAGPGEAAVVAACDPQRRFPAFAGNLSLAQLWQLLARASLLVAPDTGVAHLGRIVDVPTIALFGPGSAQLCGAGDFWRNARYRAVTVEPWPCRDQRILFRREVEWVRRCGRSVAECPAHSCMPAITTEAVTVAIDELGVLF